MKLLLILTAIALSFANAAYAEPFKMECSDGMAERVGDTTISYGIAIDGTQAQLTEISNFPFPPFTEEKVIAAFADTVDASVAGQLGFAVAWPNASVAVANMNGEYRAEIEVNGKTYSNYLCK